MSQKTAKQERKEQEAKKAESVERQKAFMKEIQAASEKYKCDLVAAIEYRKTAIVPTMVVVDVKDKYEAMTEEAKKAEQAKKAAELKNQAANGEVKENSVPKLEV